VFPDEHVIKYSCQSTVGTFMIDIDSRASSIPTSTRSVIPASEEADPPTEAASALGNGFANFRNSPEVPSPPFDCITERIDTLQGRIDVQSSSSPWEHADISLGCDPDDRRETWSLFSRRVRYK
jgi:hypothetical protein